MKKIRLLLLSGIALLSAWAAPASALTSADTHWTGVTPAQAVTYGGNCYLYNVGTGKWLGRGGRWGTEAVQSDVALAVTVLNATGGTYQLQTTVQRYGTTSNNAFIALTDLTQANDDWYTYYIDRDVNDGNLRNFTFTSVAGQVNSDNTPSNIYQLSTTSTNDRTYTEDGQTFTLTSGTYYMCAHYNEKSSDALRIRHDNCVNGFIAGDVTSVSDNSDQWIIVTEQQYREYFQTAQAAYTDPAPGTFLMHDEDFGRNDNAVTNWKRADGADLLLGDNLKASNQDNVVADYVHAPTDATGTEIITTYDFSNPIDVTIPTDLNDDSKPFIITDGNGNYMKLDDDGTLTNTTSSTDATQWNVGAVRNSNNYFIKSATGDNYLSVTRTWTGGIINPTYSYSLTVEDELDYNSYWNYNSSTGFTSYYYSSYRLTYSNGWTITTSAGNAKLQAGTATETTTTTRNYIYYVGNGLHKDDGVQKETGDKWTANIHGTSGKVYQTLTNLFREGWYRIKVNAWTTSAGSAKVYAKVGNATSSSGEVLSKYFESNIQSIAVERPATYVNADDELNKIVTLEDGTTGYQYQNAVMVYLPEPQGNTYENIEFGIEVANGADDAWTCFDNFQIEYLGDAKKVVVLDESRTDIDYINAQNTQFANEHKAIVLLHRELNVNKWNTLVLPFSIDNATINSVFGAGTLVSEFKGAINKDNPYRLYFQTTSNGIQRGRLYLIKPTKEATALDQDETARDNGDDDQKVSGYKLEAGTKVYTIPGVSFGYYENGTKQTFTAHVTDNIGKETYNGDTQVQFTGTYVSDPEGQNSVPANSYVLAYKNTSSGNAEAGKWYYRTKTTHAKGFCGWLQSVSGNTAKPSVQFVINGVVSGDDEATAIEGLTTDKQVQKRTDGVYNLNGQRLRSGSSLEGLSHGIYIVNGRKVVIR